MTPNLELAPPPIDWWRMWHKRRDIDDYRQWYGRGQSRKTPSDFRSLEQEHNVTGRPAHEWLPLPTVQFEDTLVKSLDAAEAFTRLSPYQQQLLALRAWGYSPSEIAGHFGVSRNAVETTVSLARSKMRDVCRV